MPLSVERLKELAAELANEADCLAALEWRSEFETAEMNMNRDAEYAIRKLIAIKEAEPVAWLVHAEHEFVDMHPQILGGLPRTPLIRKPE